MPMVIEDMIAMASVKKVQSKLSYFDLSSTDFFLFQVSARVNSELTKRAEQFGLILDDISITHLTFGREFTLAVELKQVAQQEAEKAR